MVTTGFFKRVTLQSKSKNFRVESDFLAIVVKRNRNIDHLPLKGVEPAFVEKRRFLTGATDKTTLDFHNFFSGTERTILDLKTSPLKFF